MISSRIYEWARSQPNKIALVHNGTALTYAVFARGIEATRVFLEGKNLPAGKTAIVLIDQLLDAWLAVMALRALGLDTVCVESMAVAADLRIGNVGCVVTTQTGNGAGKIHGDVPAGAEVVVIPSSIYAGILGGDVPDAPPSAPPGGHVLYTSGTTGSHKKVLQSGDQEDVFWERLARIRNFSRDDVYHGHQYPLWTAAGFRFPAVRWYTGATVILDERPGALSGVLAPEVTHTFLIVPMLKALLGNLSGANIRKTNLEITVSGGFVSLAMVEKARRLLNAEVVHSYGSTEVSGILRATFRTKEDLYWLVPAEDRNIEIVDECGNEVGVGEEGELRVELMQGDAANYHEDPEASASYFRDGYFYPGDLAMRREDGRIRILGRASDVLNVQGFKFAVAPLEAQVQKMLDVETVCLFSGLNDVGVDELVIAVEGDRPPDKDATERVAALFKRFEKIRFESVAEFPRSKAGMQKIDRRELRRLVFGEA